MTSKICPSGTNCLHSPGDPQAIENFKHKNPESMCNTCLDGNTLESARKKRLAPNHPDSTKLCEMLVLLRRAQGIGNQLAIEAGININGQ